MILRLFLHLSIRVVCFTNTFLSVISRTLSRDSKHGSAVYQKVMFCIELVNITFKQGILELNVMYLQFLDKVACISWEKQCNASKYFCATVEILRHCSPPPVNIREGYIIAASTKAAYLCTCIFQSASRIFNSCRK